MLFLIIVTEDTGDEVITFCGLRNATESIVIAITPINGLLAPGDRLTWAKLRITPIDARFIDWTVAYNKRNSINVGSIKASHSTTLKAETGLKIGGPLADTGVSAESTRSL